MIASGPVDLPFFHVRVAQMRSPWVNGRHGVCLHRRVRACLMSPNALAVRAAGALAKIPLKWDLRSSFQVLLSVRWWCHPVLGCGGPALVWPPNWLGMLGRPGAGATAAALAFSSWLPVSRLLVPGVLGPRGPAVALP